jgi:UDP:flavonoid glycosyltransferase YjiC (YdhE family)
VARFLICTLPMAGHVNPALPIARTLVQRGHEVWWYTGRKFRTVIESAGARYSPMQAAPDPGDGDFFVALPQLSGLAAANWGIKRAFIDPIPGQVADLRRILADFPADVLVSDQVFAGAEAMHELGGPPWAMLGISALTLSSRDTAPSTLALPPNSSPLGRLRNQALNTLLNRIALRDATNHINYVRWTLGLPPLRRSLFDMISPYLYMHSSTPAFEYPRSDLPPQVHFIGPLLPETLPDFAPPIWWSDLQSGKPVVLVNQGTIANNANDLIVPTLRALAAEDLLVVATTGGAPIETPDVLPANARVAPFIPFGALLPHVDVMITNGGYGGVQFALAHGIPLVVAGTSEEKAEINARVAWSGAGINLKTQTPTPEQIRVAVHTILRNHMHRRQAERIQADYARHNAPAEAAALLERLAETRQPVLRTHALINHPGQYPVPAV